MIKKALLLFLLFLSNYLSASHIVGGEIFYNYLGNNNYEVHVIIYRDCNSTGAAYDNPLPLGIYNVNNQLVQSVEIAFPGSQILPITFNNPCIIPPNNICTQKAEYIKVVNLPPIPGGYLLSYQRCCRGPNIVNLSNSVDEGLTLTVKVPTNANSFYINNSARFTNYPPLVICNNDDLIFDHHATDADGDVLEYSIVNPFDGLSSFNPAQAPGPSLNYGPVSYAGGFSGATPLGPGANFQINSTTGLLTGTPQITGLFVVGIQVKEYRNGVLINSTIRDFLFRIIACNITLQAKFPDQSNLPSFVSYCQGLSINFANNSYGGSSYLWDFGVPGITTDQSASFQPSYTFPTPGTYTITLIVNPGSQCTDTLKKDYLIYDELEVDFTFQDSVCFTENSFDFDGTMLVGNAATQFTWTFPNGNPASANTLDVNNVSFSTSGEIPVQLLGVYQICRDSVIKNIHILPKPIADFDLPATYECDGLTQTYTNSSQFATEYFWDFGDLALNNDTSVAVNPIYTYANPGNYDVSLIAHSIGNCYDTMVKSLTFYEPLIISITHDDSLCITGNEFDFFGQVSGPASTTWEWNFGPDASIQTSNSLNVLDVNFSQPGIIPFSFSAMFNDCKETINDVIKIYSEPFIDFGIKDGLQCAPFLAHFIDQSISETEIFYIWDFGDGNSSTEMNPDNLYINPGIYPVTLSIRTEDGCIDTLMLTKIDLIDVKPTPVSKFSLTPSTTDICHSTVFFTDESTGADIYTYHFDDINAFSNKPNTFHNYFTEGSHYPWLIARNIYGCADTSKNYVYIEPFTVYIPNAFTPDQDEHNNVLVTVVDLEPEEWQFEVYNRWGELLFVSHDPKIGWDGTYNGRLMETGLYIWKLRYISCANGSRWEENTGHFSLLR